MLGIAKETTKFHLDKSKLKDFDVFVQSTSYNRILLPDTEFLYDSSGGETSGSGKVTAASSASEEDVKAETKHKPRNWKRKEEKKLAMRCCSRLRK